MIFSWKLLNFNRKVVHTCVKHRLRISGKSIICFLFLSSWWPLKSFPALFSEHFSIHGHSGDVADEVQVERDPAVATRRRGSTSCWRSEADDSFLDPETFAKFVLKGAAAVALRQTSPWLVALNMSCYEIKARSRNWFTCWRPNPSSPLPKAVVFS